MENEYLPEKSGGVDWFFWVATAATCGLVYLMITGYWVRCTRGSSPKNACIANLKQIDGAVQQWALETKKKGTSPVTTSDVLEYLKGSVLPLCPEHGIYSVSTVSAPPMCSLSARGHSL